jgi:hypothetical protein
VDLIRLGTTIPDHVPRLFSHTCRPVTFIRAWPPPPALHVIHLIHPTGSPHRIPLPRRLRAPPCPRRTCPPFQRPLPVSCTTGSWKDDGRMAKTHHHHRHHDRHHECGFRRSCAGRALQVPRPLLRSRLRLFRDSKLGRLAILSQFLTDFFQHLSYFICLCGGVIASLLSSYTLTSFPGPFHPSPCALPCLACQMSWHNLVYPGNEERIAGVMTRR